MNRQIMGPGCWLRQRVSVARLGRDRHALRLDLLQESEGESESGVCGPAGGRRQVSERIWLVTFMHYDLGYFDDETCRLEPIENPFGPTVLPMSGIIRYPCTRNGSVRVGVPTGFVSPWHRLAAAVPRRRRIESSVARRRFPHPSHRPAQLPTYPF